MQNKFSVKVGILSQGGGGVWPNPNFYKALFLWHIWPFFAENFRKIHGKNPNVRGGGGGVKPVGPKSQLLPKICFACFPYFEIRIYQFSGLFYLVKMGQNFRARPLPLGKAMPERKPSNLRMRCSQSQAGFTLGEEKGEMSELDIFAEMRLQSVCPGWIWRE